MASQGRSSQKSTKRSAKRNLLLVFLFAAGALILAQTAPQIREMIVPVRTAAGDQLGGQERVSLWARVSGQVARERKIKELEAEVRELSRYKAAAISMAERLEAYENILNLMGEPPVRGVTARVTAESDGPFAQTLLANAGRIQGVEPGALVHFVEMRQRFALKQYPFAIGGLHRRTIHVVQHAFGQIAGGGAEQIFGGDR